MIIERFTFITILILSTIYSPTLLSECIDGKIKYIFQKKEVISNESYCYDLDSHMLMSSKPCAANKKCQSINLEAINLKMSEMSSVTGSIGFKICEKYHGNPQIIEYWAENKWHSTSRCIFSDGSFIDNATIAQKVKYVD